VKSDLGVETGSLIPVRCSMYGKCFSNIAGDPVASSVTSSLVFMKGQRIRKCLKKTLGHLMIANDLIEMV